MAYTALYRKKRPKKFGEIVGQPHVVRALVNQITGGKISHAYLFCGTRGTGKTTAAKIFARAVNCENPQNGEPCNECETCLGILSERNLGVSEIDGASNNGVDNIRDLREEVKYPPTEGRYKVYIIDEVHMLSTGAFNALLKTLEEPPAHAIFVLATTDPQKIPATILSRCQRYDFRRIAEPDMVATMQKYLEADGISGVDTGALKAIAGQSDGAMRDALSILDQAVSLYGGEEIGEDKIYELLGAADRRVLFDFTYSLAVSDTANLLDMIDAAARNGRDMAQFAADLTQHFRNVLVAAHTGREDLHAEKEDLHAGGEDLQMQADDTESSLVRQSGRIRPELLTHWLLTFAEAQRDMRYAPNPRTALEVTVLRLCSGGGEKDDGMEGVLARLAKLEAQLENLIENGIAVRTGAEISSAQIPAGAQGSVNARGVNTPASTPPDSNATPSASASSVSNGSTLSASNGSFPLTPSVPASSGGSNAPISAPPSSNAPVLPASPSSPSAVEPALFKKIQSGWDGFCREFPPLIRSMLADCGVEQDGAFLRIVCSNTAKLEFLKTKQKILSEQMKLKFGLPQTVNLAFTARDAYNNFTKAETVSSAAKAKPDGFSNAYGSPPRGNSYGTDAAEKSAAGKKAAAVNEADENPPNWDDWNGMEQQAAGLAGSEQQEDDWAGFGQVDMSEGEWSNG